MWRPANQQGGHSEPAHLPEPAPGNTNTQAKPILARPRLADRRDFFKSILLDPFASFYILHSLPSQKETIKYYGFFSIFYAKVLNGWFPSSPDYRCGVGHVSWVTCALGLIYIWLHVLYFQKFVHPWSPQWYKFVEHIILDVFFLFAVMINRTFQERGFRIDFGSRLRTFVFIQIQEH